MILLLIEFQLQVFSRKLIVRVSKFMFDSVPAPSTGGCSPHTCSFNRAVGPHMLEPQCLDIEKDFFESNK